jgi:hypothetical protein
VASEIAAARTVAHEPAAVFAFLSNLQNHWLLEDRFVELGSLDADGRGGRVLVKGPLGLSREARTEVLGADPPLDGKPGALHGRAQLGPATVGRVRWELVPSGEATAVRLSASVESASFADRALLALGGRWWLGRIFASALRRLDDVLD